MKMTGNARLAVVALVFVLGGATSSSSDCEFPEEVQSVVELTDGPLRRDWYGGIKEQFNRFSFRLDIQKDVIRTSPVDSGSLPSTRVCLRMVQGDRYLVREDPPSDQSTGNSYFCIKFVMRSPEVMQVLQSTANRTMDDRLCDDESLRLDKWLIVDKARLGATKIHCPIQGGFNTRVYDKLQQRGVCDAWHSETRLESECSSGDGLHFLFRAQSCVPDGMYMYATQPTNCLVTWDQGTYTFLVIRHNYFNYTWLMRFPSVQRESFTAYLFRDLFADTADSVLNTFNYLRFDTTRDRARDPGDLCYDEYERCTLMKAPCTTGSPQMSLTCPLTCGICQQSSPVSCRLRPEWVGKWDAENRTNGLNISSTAITVHSHHLSQTMHCVRWDQRQTNGDQVPSGVTDDWAMFVTEQSNGCRPRYTCARIQILSPTMLNVTLSRTVTWPFIQKPTEPLDCQASAFKPPKNGLETNRGRSLLVHARTGQHHPVVCQLPFRSSNISVDFQNGTECNSGRLFEGRGRKTVEIGLRECSTPDIVSHYHLSCIDSSKFPPHDDLIVLAKRSNSSEIYCLILPVSPGTTFYLLMGSESCHQATMQGARLDQLQLFRGSLSTMIFRTTTPKVTTEAAVLDTTSESRTDAELSTLVSEAQTPSSPISTLSSWTNATPPSSEYPIEEHPIVVGFVAFIFAIFQGILYFCRWF